MENRLAILASYRFARAFFFRFSIYTSYLASHLLHEGAPESHHPLDLHSVLADKKRATVREMFQPPEVHTVVLCGSDNDMVVKYEICGLI